MKVLTANRLKDGAVVYFGKNGNWLEQLSEAQILAEPSQLEEAKKRAQEDEKSQLIVAAYDFEVEPGQKGPVALSMREKIRAAHEPTILYDQGSWVTTDRVKNVSL